MGDTEPEVFSKFGETRPVEYVTAKEIVRRNKTFLQKGYVWIEDEDFIKKEHLEEYLENVVSKKRLEEIAYSKDRDAFEKDFALIPEGQKQSVITIIHGQYKKNEHDLRIIGSINNMLNIDLIKDIERFEELTKPVTEIIR